MVRFGIVALIGCAGTSTPPVAATASTVVPRVRMVVASSHAVQFVTTSPSGLEVMAPVKLPSTVRALEWVGADPVVMLAANEYDDTGHDDPKLDGMLARITPGGGVPIAAFPASTWAMEKPVHGTDEVQHFTPQWKLIASATGELWQGRCEWGMPYDGGRCDEWIWAKLGSSPVVTTRKEPVLAPARPFPTIAPSATVKVSLVPYKKPSDEREPEDPQQKPPDTLRLHCVGPGGMLDYPPENEMDLGMTDGPIRWISTDPPVFEAARPIGGLFAVPDDSVIFESCAVSKTYPSAELVAGPSELLAMYSPERLSIRWRGRELGTLPNPTFVRFAPTK